MMQRSDQLLDFPLRRYPYSLYTKLVPLYYPRPKHARMPAS